MTGKPPSNADVTIVEREVDSPSSRAARQDKIRSDGVAASVTAGATATGTIVANNSSKDWLLFHVSSCVEESVSTGNVSIEIFVRDADGNDVYAGAGDAVGTRPIQFGDGGIVRTGWSIDYRIINASGTGVTVNMYPYTSIASVSEEGDPTPDNSIDTFERTTVTAPYTHSTTGGTANNNYAAESGTVYEGTSALAWEGTGSGEVFLSTPGDGLEGYPERGDEFSYRFNPVNIAEQFRSGIIFGADAGFDNGYLLRLTHDGSATAIFKRTNGSWEDTYLASSSVQVSNAEFYQGVVDFGDPVTVKIRDEDGNTLERYSGQDESPKHDYGGIGWYIEGSDDAANKVIFDDVKFR